MENFKIIEIESMQLGFFYSKKEEQDKRDHMMFAFCDLNDVLPSDLKMYHYYVRMEEENKQYINVVTYILLCDDDQLPKGFMKIHLDKGKYLTFVTEKEDVEEDLRLFQQNIKLFLEEHHYKADRSKIVYLAERFLEDKLRVYIAIT